VGLGLAPSELAELDKIAEERWSRITTTAIGTMRWMRHWSRPFPPAIRSRSPTPSRAWASLTHRGPA